MVILDTCAIIELCKGKPTLKEKSLHKIDQASSLLSISFAEIACKIQQGKLLLNLSAQELFEHYSEIRSITIVDIGCREWFDSITMDWKIKDPVDRLIVSYAKRFNSYIVTSDKEIKKFYNKVVW